VIKIYKETSKYLICFCPWHNDVNTPNLVINKVAIGDKPKGYAHCFGCNWTGNYANELAGFESAEPIVHENTDFAVLTARYEHNYDLQSKDRFLKPFVVSVVTLKDYHIGWDGSAFTFPMYDPYDICGIHRRFADGFKCCVDGSNLGLFLPCMPILDMTVYITEGLSDACVLRDCGFYAVGKPSAYVGDDLFIDYIKYTTLSNTRFVCVGDDYNKPFNHSIGKQAANALALQLIELGYDTTVPHISQSLGIKDIRQLAMRYGKEALTKIMREA